MRIPCWTEGKVEVKRKSIAEQEKRYQRRMSRNRSKVSKCGDEAKRAVHLQLSIATNSSKAIPKISLPKLMDQCPLAEEKFRHKKDFEHGGTEEERQNRQSRGYRSTHLGG